MDAWQSAVNVAVTTSATVALGGLLVRRRAQRAWSFAVYLGLTAAWGAAVIAAPTLVTWRAWLLKELLLSLLTLAVAVEVALRVFAQAPQARRFVRAVIVSILALTVVLLLVDIPSPARSVFTQTSPAEVAAFETALVLLPRLAYGSAWILAALFIGATLNILPLDRLHRVIVIGLGAYVILYAVTLGPLNDPLHARVVSDVLTWSYLAVLIVWTYAAWRHEPPEQGPAHVVQHFLPWLR